MVFIPFSGSIIDVVLIAFVLGPSLGTIITETVRGAERLSIIWLNFFTIKEIFSIPFFVKLGIVFCEAASLSVKFEMAAESFVSRVFQRFI